MIYRFEDMILDTTVFELRRVGRRVDVQPQVLELIHYLIDNRDRLVSKEELFEKVWAGRIVSDAALSSRIKSARQTIGDDGQHQRLIKTTHGRGFRFIGDVIEEEAPGPAHGTLDPSIIPGAIPAAGDQAQAPSDKSTIAVLPFTNLSGDPSQEYLSDGITEDIITALSKFRWLMVTARGSTFTYKNDRPSSRQIAAQLGVRYILQGNVRRSGARLRIGCQLVDARSDATIWAEHFDRNIGDMFDVHDEITAAIAGAVAPEISHAERQAAHQAAPENLDAWEMYHRGMWHFWRYNRTECEQAQACFLRALALEPELADAHAALAMSIVLDILNKWSETPEELLLDKALATARKAVALDDRNPMAHLAIGRALAHRGQVDQAIAESRRAVYLNPSFAQAHSGLGMMLIWDGQYEAAVPHLQRALQLSPNDPIRWAFEVNLGLALTFLGRQRDALDLLQQSRRTGHSDFWPDIATAAVLVSLERVDEAREIINETRQYRPDLTLADIEAALRSVQPAELATFLDWLKAAGLPNR